MRPCRVPGCLNPAYPFGLCEAHRLAYAGAELHDDGDASLAAYILPPWEWDEGLAEELGLD